MKASITARKIELPVEGIEGRRRVVRGGIAPHGRSVNPAPAPLPQTFFVHWTLPGLNELLAACRSVNPRSGWQRYAALKRQIQYDLCRLIRAAKIQPMLNAFLIFTWCERNRRRDPDNITAGGRKFILDALVSSKVLPTDGWAGVQGWSDQFRVDRSRQGVHVELHASPPTMMED